MFFFLKYNSRDMQEGCHGRFKHLVTTYKQWNKDKHLDTNVGEIFHSSQKRKWKIKTKTTRWNAAFTLLAIKKEYNLKGTRAAQNLCMDQPHKVQKQACVFLITQMYTTHPSTHSTLQISEAAVALHQLQRDTQNSILGPPMSIFLGFNGLFLRTQISCIM